MSAASLTAFWIKSLLPHAPLGFGITARSLDDAIRIIHALDYGRFLPANLGTITVIENITVAELDQLHVVPNIGPIAVRGMWYPFVTVGIPKWAAERL